MNRFSQILVFLIMLMAIGGAYLWFYVFNQGTLILNSNQIPFSVQEGSKNHFCNQSPCEIKIDSGFYRFIFSSNKHFDLQESLSINRFKIHDLNLVFEKIPSLKIAPIIPPESENQTIALPDHLKNLNLISPTWNPKATQLVFIDPSDQRLKLWSADQNLQPITPLNEKNPEIVWSTQENRLIAIQDNSLYFIDLETASRFKVDLEFFPKKILWLNNDLLLVNNSENELFQISFKEKELKKTTQVIDLNSGLVFDGSFIFLENQSGNEVALFQYDDLNQSSQEILRQSNFLADSWNIFENNFYIKNQLNDTWYFLSR